MMFEAKWFAFCMTPQSQDFYQNPTTQPTTQAKLYVWRVVESYLFSLNFINKGGRFPIKSALLFIGYPLDIIQLGLCAANEYKKSYRNSLFKSDLSF